MSGLKTMEGAISALFYKRDPPSEDFQEFPKWVTQKNGKRIIVKTQAQLNAISKLKRKGKK